MVAGGTNSTRGCSLVAGRSKFAASQSTMAVIRAFMADPFRNQQRDGRNHLLLQGACRKSARRIWGDPQASQPMARESTVVAGLAAPVTRWVRAPVLKYRATAAAREPRCEGCVRWNCLPSGASTQFHRTPPQWRESHILLIAGENRFTHIRSIGAKRASTAG